MAASVVIFTAPCDRCQTSARWIQAGNQVVALAADLSVSCPACDGKEAA
jgi:endogenous inhibitor of DNA gyrase (YacG/DUF329 family)